MKRKYLIPLAGLTIGAWACAAAWAQASNENARVPQPILLSESNEPLSQRLNRMVTLDVRDMNISDIIQFMAHKGQFNAVLSPAVSGRSTVMLHNVPIKNALDVVAKTNNLAYLIDSGIVQVMTAGEYERQFGKPFDDRTQTAVVHLQYAKPNAAMAILDNLKSNIGKITIDEDTGSVTLIDTPESIAVMEKALKQLEQPLPDKVYPIKYADPEKVMEKLRTRIDAKGLGIISSDQRSMQIIARTLPQRQNEVRKYIQALDEPTREVLIKIRILQVTLKPGFDTGIDWQALIKNEGKTKFNFTENLTNPNTALTFGQVGWGTISVNDVAGAVQALAQVSQTKILSAPDILAINNQESKVHVGDTIPYITTSITGAGAASFQSENVNFINVGLNLDVIPTINKDGVVTMRIRPESSMVDATLASVEGGIPQVNKTEVETSVMVADGNTVVLSGLRKEDKSHVKRGIPGLMNVPYLGTLFSTTSDAITSTETVIFITPHIVRAYEDYTKTDAAIKNSKTYVPLVASKRQP